MMGNVLSIAEVVSQCAWSAIKSAKKDGNCYEFGAAAGFSRAETLLHSGLLGCNMYLGLGSLQPSILPWAASELLVMLAKKGLLVVGSCCMVVMRPAAGGVTQMGLSLPACVGRLAGMQEGGHLLPCRSRCKG